MKTRKTPPPQREPSLQMTVYPGGNTTDDVYVECKVNEIHNQQ